MTAPVGSRRQRRVGPLQAAGLSFSVLARQIVTPGKLIGLGILGLAMVLLAWPIANAVEDEATVQFSVEDDATVQDGVFFDASDSYSDEQITELRRQAESIANEQRITDAANYADLLGLVFIVPIVSMVFATAVLGDPREDGTLVYLWLRPMDRGAVVAGAAGAAAAVSLPVTVIPTVVGAWIVSGGVNGSTDLLVGAVAASLLGTLAYSSLFVLLGLLVRKAIFWGIGFVLLWEGLIAGLGETAARLTLRGYTRSLLANIADVELLTDSYATSTSLLVLIVVSIAALGLATLRLNRMEIA